MNDDVASPGLAHRAMAPEWDLLADLMGGTAQMRQAGARWLPREDAESWAAWHARLNRTILFNGLSRTVQALAGRPFAKPVQLDGAAAELTDITQNIDGQGGTLGGVALQILQALLVDGMVHLLLDRPRRGGPPYFVLVRARQMLAARRDRHGLQEVRIREDSLRPKGRFGEESVPTVRVIDREIWQEWRPRSSLSNQWAISRDGRHGLGQVPLITFNVAPNGFMRCRPPLIDLAWLNLAHWQSSSDQRHILHVARVPILFGRALQAGEGAIEVGPNRLILADDPAADLRFVEHSGAAIAAGRQDLIDLEDRMAVMGLDMMSRRPGNFTATARAIDAAESHAALSGFVQILRDGLAAALGMMASSMGLPKTAVGALSISRQFPLGDDQSAEAELLLRARLAGEISKSAFLAEITRRGILTAAGERMADTDADKAGADGDVPAANPGGNGATPPPMNDHK